MRVIKAQEQLQFIEALCYPHLQKNSKAKRKIWDKYTKAIRSAQGESKGSAMTTRDLARMLGADHGREDIDNS